MSSKRSPVLAFIMSLAVAGWGQVYVGRVTLALVIAGIMYGGILLAGLLGLIASPAGVYAFAGFVLLIKLSSAFLAASQARKASCSGNFPRMRTHALYVAALIIGTLTLMYPLRSSLLGYKLYSIPFGSMIPALQLGDYIVTDTRYDTPNVGDIVVYRYRGTSSVKRIAAVGGDTLSIVDGEVLNNERNLGLFFAPPARVSMEYSLTLAPVKVKPNHVYLLGDNRDSSTDSRFIGQISTDDISGKVTGVWLSKERARVGTTFD
ncbi:signal peptidase I [Pseudomonas sp. M30-35]|uniref:signal peptidase I n=1 Tax=Pseudomonas sp. M30-35 TaxID=1981174 RepID=UPI000B3BF5E6|nr:signal peptidase I [Pseudomonas sp. M30-35]ARU90579.1 signal peptidase I [Pseudomonas sp. M30-35]